MRFYIALNTADKEHLQVTLEVAHRVYSQKVEFEWTKITGSAKDLQSTAVCISTHSEGFLFSKVEYASVPLHNSSAKKVFREAIREDVEAGKEKLKVRAELKIKKEFSRLLRRFKSWF